MVVRNLMEERMADKADRVFQVYMHTPDENFRYSILAQDDVIAREEAYKCLQTECAKRGIAIPQVQFCEIRFIVGDVK
jgi:hypothetical protein